MHLRRPLAFSFALLTACPGPQVEPTTDSAASTTTTTTTEATEATEATGSGTTAPTTGDTCDGPEGCYACEPGTPVQVLNHCTDASCEPFASTMERLPLLNMDGTLPPVP